MYERMLDKRHQPSQEEFAAYCGECQPLLTRLCDFMSRELGADSLLRFPYGNRYGWGLKFSVKRKHLCDVFAERGAFTVMLRLSNPQFAEAYAAMSDDTRAYIDNKYPCGDGGWIHERVLTEQHLRDVMALLRLKAGK